MKMRLDTDKLSPFPQDAKESPVGWMDHLELQILYSAARAVAGGSILELGSWVGRSSCMIAYGVRDSAPAKTHYEIVDYGIAGVEEWEWRFGNMSGHSEWKEFVKVVCISGGTGAALKQNLVDRQLNRYVSLIILGDIADYATNRKYDFIFCDAAHDQEEIKRNIPLLKERLNKDFIFICDDVVDDTKLELIAKLLSAETYCLSVEVDKYSKLAIFCTGKYAGFGASEYMQKSSDKLNA